MNEPEPVDESKPAPEIRGGDRPADYIPTYPGRWGAEGGPPEDEDSEEIYEDQVPE